MGKSTLGRLLSQIRSFTRQGRRPGKRGRRPAYRPFAEVLEDRNLLSPILQTITPASGSTPTVAAAAGSSNNASVSTDGRFVAYESTATNLVANQASATITSNVFLFDRVAQTTTLVSHAAADSTGTVGGNADSFSAILSSNGRFLYYLSRAGNLVSGETGPATEDLFIYDTVAKTTRLVSGHLGSATQRADGDTGLLDPSLNTGAPFSVSADGMHVAYVSAADDLMSGLTGLIGPGHGNVFVADISNPNTVTTRLVSQQAGVPTAGAGGRSPALSADASRVAFVSDGTNLVSSQVEQAQPPGTAVYSGVFLYDASAQTNLLVSRKFGTTATVASATSDTPVINQDGSVVAFRSDAADLVAQQFPGSPKGNVFIYERLIDTVGLVSHAPQQLTVGTGGTPFTPDSLGALPLAISADGRTLVYQSQAAGLVGAASAGNPPPSNVYLWELNSVSPGSFVVGTNFLVSGVGGSPVTPGNGSSFAPAVSGDGSTIAFVCTSTNLISGQASTGGARNVFTASAAAVLGGQSQPPSLVSSANGSTRVAANGDSSGGAVSQAASPNLYPGNVGLSGDGSVLIFQSGATNLSTSIFKANSATDIFAFTSAAGPALVSRSAAAIATAGGNSYVASVSADDRYAAFVSDAFNVVAGQQNNHFGLNVFLRDASTGTTVLVNHVPAPGSPAATGDSGVPQPPFTPDAGAGRLVPPPPDATLMPTVSGDGSVVVFVSNDHNLLSGQSSPGSFNNVFRYKVADGSITLVSHLPNVLTASGAYDSNSPAVSFDGRFIALVSNGSLYIYDSSGPATLTLIAAGGSSPSISDDGRYVAYVAAGNAYLYDRLAGIRGTSTLISHDVSSSKGKLLALSAPPASATAGTPFSLTATVQDAFGHTDTTFGGMVTLALAAGSPAGAVLGGTTTMTATNGVANFSNLQLTLAGGGYAVTASAAGVTSAVTPTFSVVSAAASQLVFSPPPALSLVNQPLAPTVTVLVEDTFQNVVTSSSASVTVGLGSGPMGATLSGTKTVAAANGVATFRDISLDQPGSYTLTAGANGFTTVTSASFSETTTVAAVTITTVAGGGPGGGPNGLGDGGPATAATLNHPSGVAADTAGALFIADTDNNRVRKVAADGTISTFVPLPTPSGLALDATGNLYVSSTAGGTGGALYKVSPAGAATGLNVSFNGRGLNQPHGLALDAASDLFIADNVNNRVLERQPNGTVILVAGDNGPGYSGDGGPATAAQLKNPTGVAVDAAGNLYIADDQNGVVREVSGGIITTVASGLVPSDVAMDAGGNLYIADQNNYVRKLSAGMLTTVAGTGFPGYGGDGGPATAARLSDPFGVAVDASGNVFVADLLNGRVRKIYPTVSVLQVESLPSGPVTVGTPFSASVSVRDANGAVVAGYSGPVTVGLGPNGPTGLLTGTTTVNAVNGVAMFNNLVLGRAGGYGLTFTASGAEPTTSSAVTIAPSTATHLVFTTEPSNVIGSQNLNVAVSIEDAFGDVVNSTANVTVALGSHPVGATLAGTTTVAASNGVAGFGNLSLDLPGSYTLTASVSGFATITSVPFSETATAAAVTISTVAGGGSNGLGDGGPATSASLNHPMAVVVGPAGELYIADYDNNRVRKVATDGTITTLASVMTPAGLALEANGNLFVASQAGGLGGALFEVSPGGGVTGVNLGTSLNQPHGLALDANGDLFIADTVNNRVLERLANGTVTMVAGNGTQGFSGDGGSATAAQLKDPAGVAVDANGNLFIADDQNGRVREVSGGIITTVAGGGPNGEGNGGPATAASMVPSDVAVDAGGNLYIADQNNRITKVSAGIITTVAGTGFFGYGGDGGPAAQAQLIPFGLALDAQGNIFVADWINQRVRKISTPATKLALTSSLASPLPAGQPFSLNVTVEDASGNAVTGYTGTVTLTLSPNAGALSGTTTAVINSATGVATFSNLSISQPGTGYTLTASAGNLTSAATTFNVGGATATLLTVTSLPPVITAGVPFTVQVAAQDAFGHTDSSYTGSVTLALGAGSPGGAALGGTVMVNAQSGVATFNNLTLSPAGKNFSLTATAPGLTATTTAPFNVGAAMPTRLVVSQPTGIKAGIPFGFTVTAQDGNGNIATGFGGQVSVMTGTALSGTTTLRALNGVARFTLGISQPGTFSLVASTNGLPTAATQSFSVAPTPELLAITPPGSVTAGGAFSVTVAAQDAAGHTDPTFNGVVRLSVGPGSPVGAFLGTTATGNTTATAVNGVATFSGLLLTQAGSYTLTATTANLLGGFSSAFTVNAGAAARLALTPPSAAVAGNPFTVTVAVQDSVGNTISVNGPVSIALGLGGTSGATLGGTTTVTAVNGIATFTLTLDKSGVGYTLVASRAGLPNVISTAFNVGGVTTTQLGVAPPAFAVAGVPFTVAVTAQDVTGNVVPSFSGLVTLALGPNSPAGSTLGGPLLAQAVNGVATFTGLTLATPGTGYTLVASAGTLNGAAPQPLAVLAGGNGTSSHPVVSAQGNFVAYVSAASDLVPGQAATGFTNVLLYSVAVSTNSLVSGTAAIPANGNSDSPAIDLDGSYIAYRSDASNLVAQQNGVAGNVFLFKPAVATTTLLSAVSGAPHTGAGSSFAPAIDGDGSKIVYLSKANNLVAGQVAGSSVNVFLYARLLSVNALVSGNLGSATVPSNGDASNALIGRHSDVSLSTVATNLIQGVGASSNGYVNTLIDITFTPTPFQNGNPAGTTVGTLGTISVLAGQLLLPAFSLPASVLGPDDGKFSAGTTQIDGTARLATRVSINIASQSTFSIVMQADTGLGVVLRSFTFSGTLPAQAAVAQAYTHSTENYRYFVTQAYLRFLKRGPDQNGLNGWVDLMMNHGLTDEHLEAGFAASPEYFATNGSSNAGLVKGMYRDLLLRTPAQEEVNYWVGQLQSGAQTTAQVAYGFTASKERESLRVTDDYMRYLGRGPDQNGLNYWLGQFLHGVTNETLIGGFVGSPEYFFSPAKGNGNKASFISAAFLDVLHRPASPGDIAYWSGVLG